MAKSTIKNEGRFDLPSPHLQYRVMNRGADEFPAKSKAIKERMEWSVMCTVSSVIWNVVCRLATHIPVPQRVSKETLISNASSLA